MSVDIQFKLSEDSQGNTLNTVMLEATKLPPKAKDINLLDLPVAKEIRKYTGRLAVFQDTHFSCYIRNCTELAIYPAPMTNYGNFIAALCKLDKMGYTYTIENTLSHKEIGILYLTKKGFRIVLPNDHSICLKTVEAYSDYSWLKLSKDKRHLDIDFYTEGFTSTKLMSIMDKLLSTMYIMKYTKYPKLEKQVQAKNIRLTLDLDRALPTACLNYTVLAVNIPAINELVNIIAYPILRDTYNVSGSYSKAPKQRVQTRLTLDTPLIQSKIEVYFARLLSIFGNMPITVTLKYGGPASTNYTVTGTIKDIGNRLVHDYTIFNITKPSQIKQTSSKRVVINFTSKLQILNNLDITCNNLRIQFFNKQGKGKLIITSLNYRIASRVLSATILRRILYTGSTNVIRYIEMALYGNMGTNRKLPPLKKKGTVLNINTGFELESGSSIIHTIRGLSRTSNALTYGWCYDGGGIEIKGVINKDVEFFSFFSKYNEFFKNVRNLPSWILKPSASTHIHFSYKTALNQDLVYENILSMFRYFYVGLYFFDVFNYGTRRETHYGKGDITDHKTGVYVNQDPLLNGRHSGGTIPHPRFGRESLLRYINKTHLEWRGTDCCPSALFIGLKMELIKAIVSLAHEYSQEGINLYRTKYMVISPPPLPKKLNSKWEFYDRVTRIEGRKMLRRLKPYLDTTIYKGLVAWNTYVTTISENSGTKEWFEDNEGIIIKKMGVRKFLSKNDVTRLKKMETNPVSQRLQQLLKTHKQIPISQEELIDTIRTSRRRHGRACKKCKCSITETNKSILWRYCKVCYGKLEKTSKYIKPNNIVLLPKTQTIIDHITKVKELVK